MSFKVAYATPSAAVAASGTITFSYPENTTAGDFATHGHYIVADGLQAKFSQDAGTLSVSFGASDITVTYRGSTSIPASSRVTAHFNVRGLGVSTPPTLIDSKRMSYAPLVRLELGAPDTADDNGIVESQNLTAAGVYSTLAFNGVYGDPYANAYAILDVPRNVVAAWTTAAVLTVTGEDEYGDTVVESSASGTSFTGKKAFKKITSIATDTNITSLTVGTGDVLGLPAYVGNVGQVLYELKDNVVIPNVGGRVVYLQGMALEAAVDAGTSLFLVSPVAGRIKRVTTQAQGTITTGGAITVEVNTVAVDGLSITVADGSSAGDVDTDTPTAGHATAVVAVDDDIEIVFAAGFNASSDIVVIVEIEATYALDGTFVAGVQTTPTATTGDVRGTYDPSSACNGSLQFALLCALPEPNYRGVDNYDG